MLNHSASLVIQQAFSKPCLVNLISKETRLVFSIFQALELVFMYLQVSSTVLYFPQRSMVCLSQKRLCHSICRSWDTEHTLLERYCTVKPVLSGHSKKDKKLVFKTDYRLMEVESIAECSKESILQYLRPALSY